ncbi:Nudix family hydrolase [Denitratisoma oestradiolicum]|uniref:8-oxo-dGTP diphosphatase n=1 Tax=Denitratisoma oestradiolicum TaxID=311182 RepID=A0A6S6Y0N2_9PROT|nr:Nudix family hydrolase [Denitratisoma oestradiolicum]TWO79207.1 DNA mismatch repair protein MutT [Denitratisoma oestradiolicum]CAB1370853.1 Thiamine monophosphate synthase [Denitratisoma oestradiolicum]
MKLTQVAAAVLLRPDGSFLLGQRAPETFYPGYWEFPGGKVEPGETPRQALDRELEEELGIRVLAAHPWIVREHRYEHAHVRLHFFRVTAWLGELRDHVHSALAWQIPGQASVAPMLPANGPVLKALNLPDFYGITQAAQVGVEHQLLQLEQALAAGLRLVQLREPARESARRAEFARAAVALCHAEGARVLVNGDLELARAVGADGIHLPARQLMALEKRPPFEWVAASCHDREELERADDLGLDFAVLGPLRETATHPGQPGLGWEGFAALVPGLGLPVYALGGVGRDDLTSAWAAGAQGVAAIRAAWK